MGGHFLNEENEEKAAKILLSKEYDGSNKSGKCTKYCSKLPYLLLYTFIFLLGFIAGLTLPLTQHLQTSLIDKKIQKLELIVERFESKVSSISNNSLTFKNQIMDALTEAISTRNNRSIKQQYLARSQDNLLKKSITKTLSTQHASTTKAATTTTMAFTPTPSQDKTVAGPDNVDIHLSCPLFYNINIKSVYYQNVQASSDSLKRLQNVCNDSTLISGNRTKCAVSLLKAYGSSFGGTMKVMYNCIPGL
ncbi:uncharacterized protein [Clytia hemisphaerica]|uniref:Uncharacterized protein n=1 Tax=Clytia hemisphaerica TaxID=252671 RepID=A0A7M5UR91_9CNID|eukprot:TCONS_00065582-protein